MEGFVRTRGRRRVRVVEIVSMSPATKERVRPDRRALPTQRQARGHAAEAGRGRQEERNTARNECTKDARAQRLQKKMHCAASPRTSEGEGRVRWARRKGEVVSERVRSATSSAEEVRNEMAILHETNASAADALGISEWLLGAAGARVDGHARFVIGNAHHARCRPVYACSAAIPIGISAAVGVGGGCELAGGF